MKNIYEEIQWLYGSINCEGEWEIGDFLYHFVMGDGSGWNVYIEAMDRKDEETVHWQLACPFEHFDSMADVISKFKIRDDGRTFLEYICDNCGVPRILVPPPSEYYQEGSKYN